MESWSEYENSVQSLKAWFETQEKKVKQQEQIGDQTSVQNALKDCQVTRSGGSRICLTPPGLCVGWGIAGSSVMS